MSRAVAIGDERRLAGYRLAGAEVWPAVSRLDAVAALAELGDDVGLLVLTPDAHAALEPLLAGHEGLVWAVIPS